MSLWPVRFAVLRWASGGGHWAGGVGNGRVEGVGWGGDTSGYGKKDWLIPWLVVVV